MSYFGYKMTKDTHRE